MNLEGLHNALRLAGFLPSVDYVVRDEGDGSYRITFHGDTSVNDRTVGTTYLLREGFKGKNISYEMHGDKPGLLVKV